jgi:hypothetical protein
MDYKARLYLDVDGVLNADHPQFNLFGATDSPDANKKFVINVKAGGGLVNSYPMTFSPVVVKQLDAFRDLYKVELVWLSTWNENLEVLRLPAKFGGLEGGRVLHGVIDRYSKTTRAWTKWKADALLSDQKGDNLPFVWVDDEAVDCHASTVDKALPDVSKLFLAPRAYHGLTTTNLDTIEDFLKTL